MTKALIIHWKDAELSERLARLRGAGIDAAGFCDRESGSPVLRKLLDRELPAVIIIDLSRLPSHGREVALWLRQTKRTRTIPLVFVDGDPAKVERVRALLPDATYATWRSIRSAVRRAIAHAPAEPVVPRPVENPNVPAAKKLGIRADMRIALLNAPDDGVLGPLPEGVIVQAHLRGDVQLALLFADSQAELRRDVDAALRKFAAGGRLWLCWPKKSSGIRSDLSEGVVRELLLDRGWVDYKVCAIDSTWSALCFAPRRPA